MEKLQSPTEFLRIVEGMVSYVDDECKQEGSGKAVYCVAVDTVNGKETAIMCATGAKDLLARVMATTFATHKESYELLESINDYLKRVEARINEAEN